MSGKRAGRRVLRAQACNLKKAWRRVQVNSSLLVEQLLQHLSLGSAGSSMNVVYERLQQPAAAENYDDNDPEHPQNAIAVRRILPAKYKGDADDDDDDLGLQYNNVASCCINMSTRSLMQHFPYQSLVSHARRHDPHPHDHLHRSACSSSPNMLSCSLNSSTSHSSRSKPSSPNMIGRRSIAEYDASSATVLLKISIVGDSETGKTSFMAKYVWPEGTSREMNVETVGVATQEKVVHVKSRGTHIAFSIWDLGGHWQCGSMLPIVCRDAAAILIMFDLTRRSTLNSVMDWFVQVRECNKAAIAVMIGTKYDHFVDLPLDIQRAVIQQARVYARAIGAPLFFSSATHNINVQKVFKVIVAKLFDLPCPIPINLNFGEPLVDY